MGARYFEAYASILANQAAAPLPPAAPPPPVLFGVASSPVPYGTLLFSHRVSPVFYSYEYWGTESATQTPGASLSAGWG